MLSRKKVEKEVLKLNPWMKKEELYWRMYAQLEWICEHGVGHYVFSPDNFYTHGCCGKGCCDKLKVLPNTIKK